MTAVPPPQWAEDPFVPAGGFLGAPMGSDEDLRPGALAIIGAPHEIATTTRLGTRSGPAAIRQATRRIAAQVERSDGGLIDVATGRRIPRPTAAIVDLGDVEVVRNDVERTGQAIRKRVSTVASQGSFPLTLGGDHYVAYPACHGFVDGWGGSDAAKRIGYIQLDSHFDLGDVNLVWGRHWHGGNGRRAAELDQIEPHNMVWVGVNGSTPDDQYRFAHDSGAHFFSGDDIRRQGIAGVIGRAVELAEDGTDAVYLTIDIDIVDSFRAPGTGGFVVGGIEPPELLEAMRLLGGANVQGLDFVEVAPNLDPTEASAQLAAMALTEFILARQERA